MLFLGSGYCSLGGHRDAGDSRSDLLLPARRGARPNKQEVREADREDSGRGRADALRRASGSPAGVSSATLGNQLYEFDDAELIERRSFDEVPPHVEYSLTPRGRELEIRPQPLLEWELRDEY